MADGKLLNIILKTINDVQKNNKANPAEKTADPNIFDFLKDKLGDLDGKLQDKRVKKGKKPVSILELIKNQIEAAKKQNQKDPNVETADPVIFDRILNKIEEKPKKIASKGIKRIIENYHLDVSNVDIDILKQVQAQYDTDMRKIDQQYAEAIHKVIQRTKKASSSYL